MALELVQSFLMHVQGKHSWKKVREHSSIRKTIELQPGRQVQVSYKMRPFKVEKKEERREEQT